MNDALNWIQVNNLDCLTIFEMKLTCKLINILKIDCFARKIECTGTLLPACSAALHTNNLQYISQQQDDFYQTSRSEIEFVSRQLGSKFWTACWCKTSIACILTSIASSLCSAVLSWSVDSPSISVSVCFALHMVQSVLQHICTLCLAAFVFQVAVWAWKRSVTGIQTRDCRATSPCQPLQLHLSSIWKGTVEDILPLL